MVYNIHHRFYPSLLPGLWPCEEREMSKLIARATACLLLALLMSGCDPLKDMSKALDGLIRNITSAFR